MWLWRFQNAFKLWGEVTKLFKENLRINFHTLLILRKLQVKKFYKIMLLFYIFKLIDIAEKSSLINSKITFWSLIDPPGWADPQLKMLLYLSTFQNWQQK